MKAAVRVFLSSQILIAAAGAAVETTPFIWNAQHNWATGGTATQSTTGFGGDAIRAIDGNTNGNYGGGSVTHSDGASLGAFWQVDLGQARPINQIVLWNRTDCCSDRLSNFRVSVLNALDVEVFGQDFYTAGGFPAVSETIPLPAGTLGTKVKVGFLPGNLQTSLSLAEVQTLDSFTSSLLNIAMGKTATQSSEGYGGAASRAVDGNTSGLFGDNTVTHTADNVPVGNPVFWEVDLAGDFLINEIALWNRTDCCGFRLSNFRLSVFDGPVEIWGQNYFQGSGNASGVFSVHDNSGAFFTTGDRVRVEFIGGMNNEFPTNPAGGISMSLAEVQVYGQAVPEPGSAALLGLGALAALRRRRR